MMKALLISTIAAGFMASTALAGPVELTDAQLDQVAAGSYGDDHRDHDYGRHDRHGKRHDKHKDYSGHYYYPYYYNDNYNKNYNDNDNDNYNYNENNNYIYISIPFFGYGDYGRHGGPGFPGYGDGAR
jgi:hypothetical protein